MTLEELEFIDFCIFMLSERLDKSPTDIYDILTKDTNLLKDYLQPCYDVLHTQGKEYILAELIEGLKNRGINL
ncbi:MAG: DUF3791 domain-containing protein [Clostridium sp.]